MPEGPEIKVMMKSIEQLSLGRYLVSVDVIKSDFQKKTKGLDKLPAVLPKLITKVCAKGKFGYMLLEDGTAIGLTFGMTGNIRLKPTEEELGVLNVTEEKYMKHCKVKFTVRQIDDQEDNSFYFHCMRNFAWIYYFTESELKKKLSTIGPSIMDDMSVEPDEIIARWRKYNKRTICEALMEQKLVSGIGNYIKAEILYQVCIYPLTLVENLSDDILWLLYTKARELAKMAYDEGGASLYTYTGLHGDRSEFKTQLQIYDRVKDSHGNQVERMQTPDGRTTHWVKVVQTIGQPQSSQPKKITKIKAKMVPHLAPKVELFQPSDQQHPPKI